MKKSKGKHQQHSTGPIHPSFPPQGAPQPAFMGSQSAPPGQGSPMGAGLPMGMPSGMPSMGEDPNAYGGM
jgi:hypothetical protein